MINGAEAIRSLYGAYRLARLDPRGLEFLDQSHEGALRSFWAAVIVLPVFLPLILLRPDGVATTGIARLLLVEGVSYVISWTAFPVLMVHVAALLGRQTRYAAFVSAYNWSGAASALVMSPVALASTLAPSEPLALLQLAVMALLLGYEWFVTRTVLGVGGGIAAGLVFADLILSLYIRGVTDGLLQTGAVAG